MNDEQIEALAERCGARWDGSRWLIEDADFLPMLRTVADAENARLRDAIEKAADDIESWGAYASDYFKEKHNLQRDIEAARAALGES